MPVQSSCNANGSGASYVVGQVAEKGWPGPNSGMSGGKRRKRNGSKTAKRRSGKRMKGGNCGCSSSSPAPFTGGKKSRRSAKRHSAKRGSAKRHSAKRRSAKRHSAKRHSAKRRSAKRGSAKRGSAKRGSAKRGKYGGFLGVLKEAIVPFSLYALQKRRQRKTKSLY
mgnify:CR=1 FL=1